MSPIYVLCPDGQNIVDSPCPVWGARKVRVERDWYAARAKAFQHAADNGAATCIVVVNHVRLLHRPHWNGQGPETTLAQCDAYQKHALWLYLDRLLRRFSHVYVPHVSACKPWKTRRTHPWVHSNSPTIPLVAAYRVDTVLKLDLDLAMPIGEDLCRAGYDSWTVGDFFYDPLGPLVLDESGSAGTWARAYKRSLEARL